jgi:hypothetical protein
MLHDIDEPTDLRWLPDDWHFVRSRSSLKAATVGSDVRVSDSPRRA